MIEDLAYLRQQAQRAIARGSFEQAASSLFQAAEQIHATEGDYAAAIAPLVDVLSSLGQPRGALTVAWYLALSPKGNWDAALELAESTAPELATSGDLARTLAAAGRLEEAARAAERCNRVALAAIYSERAGDFAGARTLWSRLSHVLGKSAADAYLGGLVSFNLARSATKSQSPALAREAIVTSVRMLEEAADQFESMGQRERAFDCFQVLVQIGHDTGAFEHVLEGYVNSLRILREDNLKYFVLQHYEDALTAAKARGELSAAATLAREASVYARSAGMTAVGRLYAFAEGELWEGVARDHTRRGASPAIAENAVLAAILAFGEVGQFARIGRLYAELGEFDLEVSRREHYARAAGRYVGVTDELLEKNPLATRGQRAAELPEVWHDDVLEWEEGGNAEDACADVLLDSRWPEQTRRRAMLARLHALRVPATGPGRDASQASLADRLAKAQVYGMLAPLERLYREPSKAVRVAVLEALQTLFFKRSFVTLRAALREDDAALVTPAARALEALHFPHAFDPLAHILQESTSSVVRAAAISGIAQIDTNESAELLLGLLDHGSPLDRQAAASALSTNKASRFIELAKTTFPSSNRALQAQLRGILAARGVSL